MGEDHTRRIGRMSHLANPDWLSRDDGRGRLRYENRTPCWKQNFGPSSAVALPDPIEPALGCVHRRRYLAMGLYLRSRDFDAIGAIADVLTAPLTFDSPCSWALDAAQRLRDFVGGEAAILYGSGFDAPGVWSVDLDSQIRERLSQFLGHTDTTPVLRSSDPIWDASLEQRRADHIDVYSMADVRTALGNVRLEDLPIYHEVMAPSRMLHVYGMANVSDNAESHLVVMSSCSGRWRFRDDTPAIARLLLPSFRLGCGMLARAGMQHDDSRRATSALLDAMAIFDGNGKHLVDSGPELTRIVDATRSGQLLMDAIRGTARAVVASERTRPTGDRLSPSTVVRRLRFPEADVEIVATRRRATRSSGSDVVPVVIQCAPTRLPTRRNVARQHDLTTREADVALLLAKGLQRTQIARTLGLSPHTIRHHTEAVFRKLNVHTRSAVAVALLEAVNSSQSQE